MVNLGAHFWHKCSHPGHIANFVFWQYEKRPALPLLRYPRGREANGKNLELASHVDWIVSGCRYLYGNLIISSPTIISERTFYWNKEHIRTNKKHFARGVKVYVLFWNSRVFWNYIGEISIKYLYRCWMNRFGLPLPDIAVRLHRCRAEHRKPRPAPRWWRGSFTIWCLVLISVMEMHCV